MPKKRASENELAVSAGAGSRRKSTKVRHVQHATALTESDHAPVIRQLPSQDEIARLAYSYWQARGCQGGCAEEDWLRAERELLSSPVA